MSENEVLQELRRAAERRAQLANAYARRAAKYRHEAAELRRTATQIEWRVRQEGQGRPAS